MLGWILLAAFGGFMLGLPFWLFILAMCDAAKRGDAHIEMIAREMDERRAG